MDPMLCGRRSAGIFKKPLPVRPARKRFVGSCTSLRLFGPTSKLASDISTQNPANCGKMPKRKRDDEDVQDDAGGGAKARRVEHKLKLGATKVGHAFKIAKGFERQKLGRRQKDAKSRGDASNVERIDAEIGALKVRSDL